jgi:lipopolysaccharide export system permease protein
MLIGRTLARYLSSTFLLSILSVFGTVFGLVYTLDFVETMRRAGDLEEATPFVVAQLSFLRTPAVAEQVLPFAVLFGSMAALLQLSRKLELVVARAAGISAWQFLQPGLLVALAIGVVSVAVYNPISAHMKQRASRMEAKIFAKTKAAPAADIWIRQRSVDGQAIIRADAAVENSTILQRVTAFTFDHEGRFRERIEAPSASLKDGFWEFRNARVLNGNDPPQPYEGYLLASTLEPSQVRQSFTPPESVPFWRLRETIAQTEGAGLDATRYRLQYDILLARPLLFVAMVFVAATVSLRFFRFGGVARLVFGGVLAGFALYVVTELMRDLGSAGLIGALPAAWLPGVVGSLLGTLALLYQEDG